MLAPSKDQGQSPTFGIPGHFPDYSKSISNITLLRNNRDIPKSSMYVPGDSCPSGVLAEGPPLASYEKYYGNNVIEVNLKWSPLFWRSNEYFFYKFIF